MIIHAHQRVYKLHSKPVTRHSKTVTFVSKTRRDIVDQKYIFGDQGVTF